MRRTSALVFVAAIVACTGDPGPPGPPGTGAPGEPGEPGQTGGPQGDPSVSGIVPGTVFLDRKVDVTIGGFATTWASTNIDPSSLDFGAGVTVTDVQVASPGALSASLTIAVDAPTGVRDVTIDGLTYVGAFSVESPLTVDLLQDPSTVRQGSVVSARIIQNDPTTPFQQGFDPSTGENLLQVSAVGKQSHFVYDVSNYSAFVDFLIDVDTPEDFSAVVVTVGSLEGTITTSVAAEGLDVAANTPQALPTAPVTMSTSHETHVYELSVGGLASVTIDMLPDTSTVPMPEASVHVLPASGHWEDEIFLNFFDPMVPPSFLAPEAGDYYVIVRDRGGDIGYDYDLNVTVDTIVVTPLSSGVPVVGDIAAPPDESDLYSFDYTGGALTVDVYDGPTSTCFGPPPLIMAEVLVLDADFNVIFGEPFAQCFPLMLPPSAFPDGTYYIAVQGSQPHRAASAAPSTTPSR